MTSRLDSRILLGLSLVLVLLAACRLATPENEAESTITAADQSQTSQSTAESAGAAVAPTIAAEDIEAGAIASLPNSITAMLAEAGDYRIEVNLSFEGRDATGTPVAFEMVSTESVAFDQRRRRLDLASSGGSERDQFRSMSLLRFDDAGYLYVPDVGCVSGEFGAFADDMKSPLDPKDMLEGLTGAQPVAGNVTINGLETTDFRFDQTSLPWAQGKPWSLNGAAFVQEGSNFVTRVDMTISGRGDLLGDGRILDGEYGVVINITRAEGDEAIVLPDACSQSALYPMPPDAFEVAAIEDLLAFRSRLPLDDIVDFYMSQMPAAGWRPLSEPEVFDVLAIMNFEQGGSPLMITAAYDGASNTVDVLISP